MLASKISLSVSFGKETDLIKKNLLKLKFFSYFILLTYSFSKIKFNMLIYEYLLN